MSMFLYRMPSGIPGALTRAGAPCVVEPNIILGTNPPLLYGIPVAVDPSTGKIRPIGAGDTIANVYGILVRPFPTQSAGVAMGAAVPPTSGMCDVLKAGYINVKVNASAVPVKNGAVYIRTVANGGNTIIGGIEAAADSTNTFVLTGAYFTGATDANGNGEVAYALQ
jgi:hypothetical protein